MKTIAAIATAQGVGGIGIIRISGDKAIKIGDKVFRAHSGSKLLECKGYQAKFGQVVDNGEVIDDAIALVFRNPHSYTGEDVVEISCHGGLYITRKTLELVIKAGASFAEPGEFTKRAFLNGKLGLTQAEAIMDIISAKGHSSAKAAILAKDGALFKKISEVKQLLLDIVAGIAVYADYPDEDLANFSSKNIKKSLETSKREIDKLIETYETGRVLREGVYTAIVGKPNVGKSTLMNLLSGCERSIVTDVEGTTRDVIEETIILGDITMRIADTAGIRTTKDEVEKIGVERAKHHIKTADLILAIFDASKELSKDDFEIIDALKDSQAIAIINKSDLDHKINMPFIMKHFDHIIEMSAKAGLGLDFLQKEVSDLIGLSNFDPSDGIIATERQKNAARLALDYIKQALEALDLGFTIDVVAISIESAIENLLKLTGEVVTEAVVDNVFAKFCVGK